MRPGLFLDRLRRLAEHLDPGEDHRSEPSSRRPRTSDERYDDQARAGVVPTGYAQGRADLQLTHRPAARPSTSPPPPPPGHGSGQARARAWNEDR